MDFKKEAYRDCIKRKGDKIGITSGVARGGGLRGLEPPPPLRWSGYAVNGSGQQAAIA